MKEDEKEIIKKFLDGDDFAYEWLYKKYVKELFSYGKGLGFNQEAVKDCIQNIFYKILCNREIVQDINDLKYFLFRSLKNALLNLARSSMQMTDVSEHETSFTIKVTILDKIIEDEDRNLLEKQIEELLNTLSDRQREAIFLRYIQGMEYGKIAEILEMSIPSARNLVARAISKMRGSNSAILLLFLSLCTHCTLYVNK